MKAAAVSWAEKPGVGADDGCPLLRVVASAASRVIELVATCPALGQVRASEGMSSS